MYCTSTCYCTAHYNYIAQSSTTFKTIHHYLPEPTHKNVSPTKLLSPFNIECSDNYAQQTLNKQHPFSHFNHISTGCKLSSNLSCEELGKVV